MVPQKGHALKAFINFFEVPQRSVKIKIEVNFLSSSGIKINMNKFKNFFFFSYMNKFDKNSFRAAM